MKSVIRNIFQNYIPDWITLKPNVEKNWNAALQTFEGHCDYVEAVAFSHDSKLLASADNNTIMIWDMSTGSLLQTLRNDIPTKILSFSHDSKLLGSASRGREVNIWNVDAGFLQHTFRGHGVWVTAIALSQDLKLLALQSSGNILIWNISIDALQQTLKRSDESRVESSAFSHDSELLALASSYIIEIWNISTNSLHQRLDMSYTPVTRFIAWSHDLKLFASKSFRAIDIWDISIDSIKKTFRHDDVIVRRAAFSHDSKLLASTSEKAVKIWDISIDSFQQTLDSHSDGKLFSNDSKLLASANKKKVMIWNTSTDSLHQTLDGHDDLMRYTFSPDSQLLASADLRAIRIWNISMGILSETFDSHFDIFTYIEFSHDSKLIASVSGHQTVTIRNISNGSVRQTLLDDDSFWSVVFSHDSKLLASSTYKKIKIWDINTCVIQQTFDHSDLVHYLVGTVAFSHDSKLLASSGANTIKIWDINTGFVQQTVAINNYITSLSFDSADSNLLTNTGYIKIKKTGFLITSKSSQEEDDEVVYFRGLNISESWITWNNQNLLWLPPDYRSRISLSPSRSIVAIDRGPGGMASVMKFSLAILGNLLGD
jgi:WD40 repeat protein